MKTISFNIPWHIFLHFPSYPGNYSWLVSLLLHLNLWASFRTSSTWKTRQLQYMINYTFVPRQHFIIHTYLYYDYRAWRPIAYFLRIIPLHIYQFFKIQTLLLIPHILYLALTTICTFLYNGLSTTTFGFTIIHGLYYHRLTHFYIFFCIYTHFVCNEYWGLFL